jgi:hypothetical protein
MFARSPLWCLAVLVGGLVSADPGMAQYGNQDAAKKAAAERKAKLYRGGTWTGRVAALEKEDVSFTFETEIRVVFWEVVPVRDAYGRVTGIRRTTRVYREPLRAEVWLPEEVKVRRPPKPTLNENGRPVPSNGKNDPGDADRKLGGSPGSWKDLRQGQQVRVALARDQAGHLFAKTIHILSER